MLNDTPKVLVLDGDMPSTLAIVRSLARRGIAVDLAYHTARPVAAYSRWVASTYFCPDPLAERVEFLNWFEGHLAAQDYSLIVPVTERTLVPISQQRERFGTAVIAMPSQASLELVLDKSRTFALAEELSIGVPKGLLIESAEDLEHLHLPDDFPVVVKPARSVGTDGSHATQLKVDYAFSTDELVEKTRRYLRYGHVILQECVKGLGVGVELIASQGEILYAFQHQRMHEVPLTGGGSSLRRAVPLDPALREASEKLIRALRWDGVAMVEFKHDKLSGAINLMEINGRFWGSLPLAVAAGADFPWMLYQLLVNKQTQFPAGYREDIICRRLDNDLLWYEMALRKAAPAELKVIPTGRQMLKDLLLVLSPRHRFDVQAIRDWKPGVVDVARILQQQWQRICGIVGERRFLYRQVSAWKRGTVQRKLRAAKQVLFVCYGNINRSAVAGLRAEQSAMAATVDVKSAGFHHEEGRDLDPQMAAIANEDGVQPDSFRSTTLFPALVNGSDVIFVMEQRHFDALVADYPDAADRTYLLGIADGSGCSEVMIPDPYGQEEHLYRSCYTKVVRCVDRLAQIFEDAPVGRSV